MRAALIAFCLLGVAGISLWWVQAPPRGDEGYRKRSAQTAESLRSHVATARLWVREVADERVTRGAAAIALEESSSGADSTASSFESWVPPSHLDQLRTRVADAASATTDLLGEVHVSAEQDEWQRVADSEAKLRELEVRLTKVAAEARP